MRRFCDGSPKRAGPGLQGAGHGPLTLDCGDSSQSLAFVAPCPHLNAFWRGGYLTITNGHAHPPQGIMYPAMGLEYAVSCCWIMQACNGGVVFSARAICARNRTRWSTAHLTCPISSPHFTVSACNFPWGWRGVQRRLNALAARAGAFVHLPVCHELHRMNPVGPCLSTSWSSQTKMYPARGLRHDVEM